MAQKIVYYIRPECGCENREGQVIGPFNEYLQLTYRDLTGLDGVQIATYVAVEPAEAFEYRESGGKKGHCSGWYFCDTKYGDTNQWWSDLVIYAEIAEVEDEPCSQCGQREKNHQCPQR